MGETGAGGGGIDFDDDVTRLDLDFVWTYLSTEAYWNRGRTREQFESQVASAWRVVGAYRRDGGGMVGFARAFSDGIAMAWLADVFVATDLKGGGIGTGLVRTMIEDGPGRELAWGLHTADAHEFYARFGFAPPGPRTLERPPPGRAG